LDILKFVDAVEVKLSHQKCGIENVSSYKLSLKSVNSEKK